MNKNDVLTILTGMNSKLGRARGIIREHYSNRYRKFDSAESLDDFQELLTDIKAMAETLRDNID
jgi:hypothetical protein